MKVNVKNIRVENIYSAGSFNIGKNLNLVNRVNPDQDFIDDREGEQSPPLHPPPR